MAKREKTKRIIYNKIVQKIIIIALILLIFSNKENASTSTIGEASNAKETNFAQSVEDEKVNIGEIQSEVIETNAKSDELKLESRVALIYDRASGRILYEKNGNKQTPMASTTKIMTAIVVLENANLGDVVTIDAKAAGIGGSRLGLKKNDKITVNDLLYGLMLRSGNDAAVALARYVGGSIEGFADMMNKKASEMGLVNSHFVVPHGLDNDGHYTTAYELAKMADYALKIDKFKQIVSTKSTTIIINGYPKAINNTNQLLGSVNGVYGVKTGFTNGAGRCLVTACKRNDLDIITVIIGSNTTKQRTSDTIKLIEYAFKNFEVINLQGIVLNQFKQWKNVNESRIIVEKGTEKHVKLQLENLKFTYMALPKAQASNINIEANCIYYVQSPIAKGQIIGNFKIMLNDELIEVLDITVENEIKKKGIQDYLQEFMWCIREQIQYK